MCGCEPSIPAGCDYVNDEGTAVGPCACPLAGYPRCEPYLFERTCRLCGFAWGSGHCPHDGVQNPCPGCGWIEPGARTLMQKLALVESPPAG